MVLEDFIETVKNSKWEMATNEAADHICKLLQEAPPMPKIRNRHNEKEFNRRIVYRSVCAELEKALRTALPWEDYREIFARLMWPVIRRLSRHAMEDIYNGEDGERWGEADAWFVDRWTAYDYFLTWMPGELPDSVTWKAYRNILGTAQRQLKKYRRK